MVTRIGLTLRPSALNLQWIHLLLVGGSMGRRRVVSPVPVKSPRDGLRVRAQAHVSLEIENPNRHVLEAPNVGVPVSFEWHYPDAAGFQAMRTRLNQLLQNPANHPYHV